MKTIVLNKLSWKSYSTLCTIISACIGFTLSVLVVLLEYVVNVDFSIRFGGFYINGGLFSIVTVFISPFVGAAIGFLGSILTQPLFALVLDWFSGVPITGVWVESKVHEAAE